MSMSAAEQRLPQHCFCHPDKRRTFSVREGRFLNRRSRFICHECDAKRRKSFVREDPGQRQGNRAAEHVAHHLKRTGYSFTREFKIGKFSFDFAFLRLRVLLEVDGWVYHRYKPAGLKTPGSREAVAAKAGWTLVHVLNGPGLSRRAVAAVVKAAYGVVKT